MLSFSVIICYSAMEIGLYSLYRKRVIAAFKLNGKKSFDLATTFRERKAMFCLSQAKIHLEKATILFMCAR